MKKIIYSIILSILAPYILFSPADAIKAAGERLAGFSDRVTIIRSNYAAMKEQLSSIGITEVDGILLDLGVSSYQLDDPQRGFTYREESAPLDMRMDDRETMTAATAKRSCTVLSAITGRINLRKISQNILCGSGRKSPF